MFCPTISACVKRSRPVPDEKFKYLEQGINYIGSSFSSIPDLLKEILGFKESECEAFKKLNISNDFFLGKTIVRELVYLITILYIKQKFPEVSDSDSVQKEVNNWLNLRLGLESNQKITLNPQYIKEVQLRDGKVTFANIDYKNYPTIKIEKLFQYINPPSFRYTEKIKKLGIEEIFHNHVIFPGMQGTGLCVGLNGIVLEGLAGAYQLNKYERILEKRKLVQSLEFKNGAFTDDTIYWRIESKRRINFISKLSNLNYFTATYATIGSLPQALFWLVGVMKDKKIPQLYCRLITMEHYLGLIIIVKGDNLKFITYDSDDPELYSHLQVHKDGLSQDVYKQICNQFAYLAKQDPASCLLVKAYIPNNLVLLPLQVTWSNIIGLAAYNIKELLFLAIDSHDQGLVKELVENQRLDLNFDYQNYTPLSLAIDTHKHPDHEIIKILIKNGANVNRPVSCGKSPLYIALLEKDEQIIKILLSFGATLNNGHPEFNPQSLWDNRLYDWQRRELSSYKSFNESLKLPNT